MCITISVDIGKSVLLTKGSDDVDPLNLPWTMRRVDTQWSFRLGEP